MECIHPLKAYRRRHDPPLSKSQLAKRLGVSRVAVSRYESGSRKPDLKLLAKFTAETGISAEELRPDLAELMGEAAIAEGA